MSNSTATLPTEPLGRFGVKILSTDVEQFLESAGIEQLGSLFDDHGLIVFRGLELDPETQNTLVSSIGRWPLSVRTGSPAVRHVSNVIPDSVVPFGRLLFHSDWMWTSDPLKVVSLYGERVDAGAAPTRYVNTAVGYGDLPDGLRQRLSGLTATYVNDASYDDGAGDPESLHPALERPASAVHPVVYPHPRTGKPLLSVNQMMTKQIDGLELSEGQALLEEIYQYLYAESNQVEFGWREGDLAVWDNLAIQHGRPNVARDGAERTLRRVTLGDAGEREKAGKTEYS